VNVSFQGVSAEAVLLGLDLEGIAASSGSACTTGVLEPSHVLLALGLSKKSAEGSLRFTMGRNTTEAEIDTLLDVRPGIVERLRSVSPLY
jgi:cysteine desulfurase